MSFDFRYSVIGDDFDPARGTMKFLLVLYELREHGLEGIRMYFVLQNKPLPRVHFVLYE